jgi:dual specificity phosphatase 12
LQQNEILSKAHVTHVLSALKAPLDPVSLFNVKHAMIEVDDLEEEDILQHFPVSNAFIQEGLDGGGGVLVHW